MSDQVPTSVEILDTVRRRLGEVEGLAGPVSDYRVAQVLGIKQPTISEIRRGKTTLGAPTLVKIAEVLRVPAAWLLACVQAERAQNEGLRRLWTEAAYKLAMCLIVGLFMTEFLPHWVHAGGGQQLYTLCAALGLALGAAVVMLGARLGHRRHSSWHSAPSRVSWAV